MKRKIKFLMVCLAFALLCLTIAVYSFSTNKPDDENNVKNQVGKTQKQDRSNSANMVSDQDHKYYVIYIKQKNGTGSSFVPEKLNPGFTNDSDDFNVSISFDDKGNIINNDKVIEVEDFSLSDSNKKKIREIAGADNYDAALKEVEDRVLETKEDLEENSNFNS
ncbi:MULTISPECIES: hypothetical protein [Bacillus]|uniref:hypothetical protein n=1 Tax=Bacillus TaxID=1386 RepID=UPI001CDC6D98|nr:MULTISPECIES: hypothetical protein [Bacillus]MCY7764705.1 hypothetical protein [Bacillus inaquosorum]MCY7949795.1 hypothetical protein [Bacillus inaquosorum]MCY9099745.1 hypothetical protein [Bacillus inaquosorum]MCY9308636.1 hypothetical protein [Bacillus inaquosorum]MEC0518380.1 hypothetical protein [Bacillus inaquosorum]